MRLGGQLDMRVSAAPLRLKLMHMPHSDAQKTVMKLVIAGAAAYLSSRSEAVQRPGVSCADAAALSAMYDAYA